MSIPQAQRDRLSAFPLHEIARLPAPGDNVAIATRRLDAGMAIVDGAARFVLDFTILEGHRFAVAPIAAGEPLLSWGLPFGVATRGIAPGNYVTNGMMIEALEGRRIDFEIPKRPNFRDQISPYILEETSFRPGKQVSPHGESRFFLGYHRGPNRGVGTRNKILILGTTSRTSSYVRQLEARLQTLADDLPNVDGIVALAHTEGSGDEPLNNGELLLRTLAGLMVHANVGAVLAVDAGPDLISNASLRQYLSAHDYPLDEVLHRFLSLEGDFQADLAAGGGIIRSWLAPVNQMARSSESVSHFKLALQCGGSDAFSGVSGNPLAASVAREIIGYGGCANMGETDELIGAEAYMLQNVRDLGTAQALLESIARFKQRLSWHGATAEGNVTGGNRYRGLYNIALKSVGAAVKRHPEVRLDHVIAYAQRMESPGFYFMDTPGNDLESNAGQVAGGSNLILFVTGNGSITNFPLVPTLKIMTTTGRFRMLANDMDVNAGAYQDGVPMADLTSQTLELAIAVASGQRSAGERAGHAQVSIWRNWRQTDGSQVARLRARPRPAGRPISINAGPLEQEGFRFQAIRSRRGPVADRVGLILPTSICAGQIARMAAARLNQSGLGIPDQLSRFVSLTHTEGCGVALRTTKEIYDRTMINYAVHPSVRFGLFLEHGCEKTHNDYMRRLLERRALDPDSFGWASVQLDGGIKPVLQEIERWFRVALSSASRADEVSVGLEHHSLGLMTSGPVSEPAARALSRLARTIVSAGGTVILPQPDALLSSAAFLDETFPIPPRSASLAYGQLAREKGFHIMDSPSKHWVETMTGLGATGVELLLAYVGGRPMQGHPLLPLIQVTAASADQSRSTADFDLVLRDNHALWAEEMLQLVMRAASRTMTPKLMVQRNVDFQITRGLLGIST